jgi:hypothetical protein
MNAMSVIILSVVMLSVTAPTEQHLAKYKRSCDESNEGIKSVRFLRRKD